MQRTELEAARVACAVARSTRAAALLLALAASVWPSYAAAAAEAHQVGRIEGYALATLERELEVVVERVSLVDGALEVVVRERPPSLKLDTLVRSLLAIEGVERVEVFDADAPEEPIAVGPRLKATAGDAESDADSDADPAGALVVEVEDPAKADASGADEATASGAGPEFLPRDELFDPLRADPRWPRFTVAMLHYLDDPEIDLVGAVSFGETFPLVRWDFDRSGKLELGIQGGVFSAFDLEAPSSDLVNSDFLGGAFASYHLGDFVATLRVYHQSSHLGDEFLLRNRVERVNLSFEVVDLLLGFQPADWIRLYAGGGLLVHREPALDRGLLQTGVELESPEAFAGGWLRPVVALDVQLRQESDWNEDLSLRFGLQIEHPRLRRVRLALLGDYYRGRSPNGQFFVRRIETIGFGLHANF